jgi:prophage regulatory protein
MIHTARIRRDSFEGAGMDAAIKPIGNIIRKRDLLKKVGCGNTTLYEWLKKDFPKPIRLGSNSVGWLESEIDAWLQSRIDASRAV